MAGRIVVGGAEFELSAPTQKLQQDMLAAEQITQKSFKQIASENEKRIRAMEAREDKWIRDFDRRQQQQAAAVARAAKQAADVQIKEQARVARERERLLGAALQTTGIPGIGGLAGGAAAAGAAAIAATALAMRQSVQAAQEAERAQASLGRQFGVNRDVLEEYAQQASKAFGIGLNDVRESINLTATLQRNYGLTTDQIKQVIKVSADLAALSGKSLPDATQRVQAALRGEAEAAEALGLTLNSNAIKATAAMTEEQRKNFETLGPLEKTMIIYNELMRQTADLQGAAADRANSAAGGFDKLGAASEKLQVALGKELLPVLGGVASGLADVVDGVSDLIPKLEQLARTDIGGISLALANPNPIAAIAGLVSRATREEVPPSAVTGPLFGPTPEEVRRGQEIGVEQARRRAKAELEDRQEQAENLIRIETERIRETQELREREIAEERIQLTKERDQRIRAAEDTRDAGLKAIEDEEEAFKDQHDTIVAFQQQERDAAKDLAEWKRDTAIKALKDEEEAAKDRFDAEIKAAERAKDERQQAAEDTRDAAIKAIEDEARAIARARTLEDREFSDRQQQEQRDLQERQQARDRDFDAEQRKAEGKRDRSLGRIDREKERNQEAHDAIMRQLDERSDTAERLHSDTLDAIDEERDAEKQRHDETMRGLEAEEKQRLGILDAQLALIDAEDERAQRAQQDADDQERLKDAQSQLANEREVAAGIGGDPKLIAAAQKNLQKVEEDIRDTRERRERESLRTQLEDQKDAITDEIKARKDQLEQDFRDTDLRLQKRRDAADAEYQIVKDQVDKEKQAAAEGLADRTKKLEQQTKAAQESAERQIGSIKERRDAEQDADRKDAQQLKDRQEREQRALDDRRYAEDEDRRIHREQVQATYEEEQKAIRATFDDESTGIIPALRRSRDATIKEFGARSEAVRLAYEQEQGEIDALYNGPKGVFATLAKQATEAKKQYDQRKTDVGLAYKAERDDIRATYDDQETGILAKLIKTSEATKTETENQVKYWQQWGKDVRKEIQDAQKDIDKFIASGQTASGVGRNSAPGSAGGVGSMAAVPDGGAGEGYLSVPGLSGSNWAAQAKAAASHAGYPDPDAFERQIRQESANYDEDVIWGKRNSSAGAQGIAQFMPGTAKGLGINPLNPQEALLGAARYMTYLVGKYGSVRKALVAYNAGEGFADKWDGSNESLYGETRQYLKIIGYASGGIAWHPQLAVVGEGGEPEVIARMSRVRALGIDPGLLVGRKTPSPDSAWGGAMSRMADYERWRGKRGGDTTINVNGAGVEDVAAEIERRQRRQRLLEAS